MPLILDDRSVGDVTVIAGTGRIVDGEECAALDAHVTRLLPLHPDIVLNLAGVDFVDSAGLGLLIKLSSRARASNGSLKLCCLQRRIGEVMRVTKFNTILDAFDTESAAIASFYAPSDSPSAASSFEVDVLCVHPSSDVLAYVREVLRQAGYGVATATNLSDAGVLLRATRPKAVVLTPDFQLNDLAQSSDGRLNTTAVVQLSTHFSTEDAGDAAKELLADVARAIASD
jgi:anti-sigma B factor antagonist